MQQRLGAIAALAIAAALLYVAPAQAQATTTFVSVAGLDTNPCTNAAPCRSFQHAYDVTAAGGTITALDAAGYGAVTVTKAISIVNDGGGEAGINDPTTGQDAITVSAGAGDVVNLRGLTLNGLGTGRDGIRFTSGAGAALNIQNCQIRNFAEHGVLINPPGAATVTISDTIVSNNGGDGIRIEVTFNNINAYLQRVAAVGNALDGIILLALGSGTVNGTVVDSASGGNGPSANGRGFLIGFNVNLTIINSKAIHNSVGILSTGTTYISQTTLAGNVNSGFNTAGSPPLHTFGDNYIIDTTNVGGLTPISTQ